MASRDFLRHIVSTTEPTASTLGDEWFNPSTNRLYKRVVNSGTNVVWREVPQPTTTTVTSGSVTTGKTIAMAIVFGG
jgi:hypothetical protein